jgi:acyl-CoA reductase-like NAD-dependent aldehyde dehydrogenase
LLVQRGIYEDVLAQLADRFSALRARPPVLELEMGPLINRRQFDQVRGFVQQAQADGIRVMAKGRLHPDADASGFYHEAVLLRDVPHEHRVAQEEIFGPVLAAMPFDDEAEAIRLANGTAYGLVAGGLDARRRATDATRTQAAMRTGVREQLPGRGRRGAALRLKRIEVIGAGMPLSQHSERPLRSATYSRRGPERK